MKKILSLVLSVLIVLTIINVLKNQEQVEQSNQESNNQEQVEQSNQESNNQEQVEQSNQESQNNEDVDDHTSYVPENNGEHKDVSEERKRLWGTEYQEGETHNPNARVYNHNTGEQVQ
ncbi:hypothetical protein qdsa001_198 [Staphylococcus phage qdsa001]|nr:hypothetical protein qdsa001_198 [Staphylococcus phage qdsa001]UGL60807.1 hypothetical protein [Staphylococcus phage vB_SauM-HM01]